MQVFKFGGASVKDAAGIRNLCNIMRQQKPGEILVVISAMGKTTNALEELWRAYLDGKETSSIFDGIKTYHFGILEELFEDKNHPVFDDINNTFVEIDWILEEDPHPDEDFNYDQIVSIGELVSTKMVAAYLNQEGLLSHWLDARSYIHTDNTYREGVVNWEKTCQSIQKDIPAVLKERFIITQGFIGGTTENFTTTLGREGSDYTGAIFASCLDAKSLTIWKDVPGVLNADPKWFDETHKIPHLSYHDAIELTYYGATVIHPKTIKPLKNKGIPLLVRSFIQPELEGTRITDTEATEHVPSFIFKVNQVLISIFPKDYSFIIEENLGHIFTIFHQNKIKINTMFNSALSFSVSIDFDERKITELIKQLREHYTIRYNKNMELVTIRYYNQDTIDRVTVNKDILLEVKSRHTCQMVMKDKE